MIESPINLEQKQSLLVNVLSEFQSGIRTGHSTITTAAEMILWIEL